MKIVQLMNILLNQIKEHLDSKVSSMLTSAPTASDGNIKTETDDEVFASIDETGFSTMEESSVLNCTFSQDLENNGQSKDQHATSVLVFVRCSECICVFGCVRCKMHKKSAVESETTKDLRFQRSSPPCSLGKHFKLLNF